MVTGQLLSLDDQTPVATLSNEADYHRLWMAAHDESRSAEETAFAGGMMADRLSFLFIAGYQAAVRRTFSLFDRAWTALAVSEDRHPDNPKPGLTQTDGSINGFKTWVASSRFIDHLIVTVRTDTNPAQLYKASRHTPGITLTHKPSPGFITDMSQGIAAFSHVQASELQALEPFDLKLFAKREPLYLYFAFCGFLHKRGLYDVAPLLDNLLVIASADFTDPAHKALFAATDTSINDIFSSLAPGLFAGNYEKDRGLMSLYSKVIRKRAGLG